MRVLPTISLIALGAMFVAISVCEPTVLSGNKFLDDFVNHEYINVLAVIVTVSLVSVVQIHLEYSRVERRFKTRIFGDARRTVNAGALWLTGLLIGSFVLSFFRASFIDNPVFVSMIHGAALLTVLTAIYIMYDFVRVVFALASEEPLEGDDANP